MVKVSLSVKLQSKSGKEKAGINFLESGFSLAN